MTILPQIKALMIISFDLCQIMVKSVRLLTFIQHTYVQAFHIYLP
jgi:hypothetical protein